MNRPQRKREPRMPSPGKRWQTTAGTALEEVAQKLAGNYNRAKNVEDLRKRKLQNTTTSISFGNEKVDYQSDTHASQQQSIGGYSPEERANQTQRIKDMKADLTKTKFTLGDETPEYESTNKQAMRIAEENGGVKAGTVAQNKDFKAAMKKSSINFGNETPMYRSIAHDAMDYKQSDQSYAQLKDEVKEMTKTLRKHNFSFGDEKPTYESDYSAGYGHIPKDTYKKATDKKAGMRAIIEDSRSCHFSLGHDKIDYLSNTHSALRTIENFSSNEASQSAERAKAMKLALQRTSLVIGDDEEYY